MASAAGGELRRRPGRFVATLIAIAISVAFVVAASVATATEQHAIGRQLSLGLAKADLVAVVTSTQETPAAAILTGARAEQAFLSVSGVMAVDHVSSTPVVFSKDAASASARATSLPASVPLLPSEAPATGVWPADASQVALSKGVAAALGAAVGDAVQAAVGMSGAPATMRVVGLTDDASAMTGGVAWVTRAWFTGVSQHDDPNGTYAIALRPDADAEIVASTLRGVIALPDYSVEIVTLDEAVATAADQQAGGAGTWRTLLWAFAAIALVVGAITIVNTYTILTNQRRRQTGLLRAIGADSSQVRRSMLLEAVIVGLIGSALGVALGIGVSAIVARLTGALAAGLTIPWIEVEIAFLVGVAVTVVAAMAPVWAATRVSPLEALQPVPTGEAEHGASVRRAVVAGVAIVVGAAAVVAALVVTPPGGTALLVAVAGCCVLGIGILVAARWFVPALVQAVGKLAANTGPVAHVAVANTVRNPRRTAAAATALILATGLIVTLQVAMASVRDSVLAQVDTLQPVAVRVTYDEPAHANPTTMPTTLAEKLRSIPGVSNAAILAGLAVGDDKGGRWTALGYTPDAAAVAVDAPNMIATDEAVVNPASWPDRAGDQITLSVRNTQATFAVTRSAVAGVGEVLLAPAALQTFGGPHDRVSLWLAVPDRAQASSVATSARAILAGDLHAVVSGAVFDVGAIQDGVFLVTGVATLLLVVAVVIALLGLGNTLVLSVIERQRESALMRALGLSAGGLRQMLLIEALLIAAVATVVGIVVGLCFGAIGLFATLRGMGNAISPVFSVDWLWIVGLLVVVPVAAVLASILPGARAAKAAPMEALADVG